MPTNGDRANPDWIHCCFSCELRSVQERVLCKKPVNSFRNSCTTFSEAEESSESYSESGKRLQRRVHSLQLKIKRVCRAENHYQPSIEFRVRLSDKQDTLPLSISIDSLLRIDYIRAIHKITPSVQWMLLWETLSGSRWKPGKEAFLP